MIVIINPSIITIITMVKIMNSAVFWFRLQVHLPEGHGEDFYGRIRAKVPTWEIRVVESRSRRGAASGRRRRILGEETEDGRGLRTVSPWGLERYDFVWLLTVSTWGLECYVSVLMFVWHLIVSPWGLEWYVFWLVFVWLLTVSPWGLEWYDFVWLLTVSL